MKLDGIDQEIPYALQLNGQLGATAEGQVRH